MALGTIIFFIRTAFELSVAILTLVVEGAYAVQNKVLAIILFMTLGAWSMISLVIVHVAHSMTRGTALKTFLEHIIMAVYATGMCCIANARYLFASGICVTVPAFLRFIFNVFGMVTGLTVVKGIFLMSGMVEI